MRCNACGFENRQGANFCKDCGTRLDRCCPGCGASVPPDSCFCDRCGCALAEDDRPPPAAAGGDPPLDGERKHATVLFTDLSGYTAMAERLDPEDVKEITSRIFAEIARIIVRYEGFVEKYVGDAVMAVFGVPKAHEDDPVRAIKAAMEIHRLVESLSPVYAARVGQPLSMHSGINTGLVVTGAVDLEKGTHGIAGDTINLAARLSDAADAGQIVTGPDTFLQAEGHFRFEAQPEMQVRGKADRIQPYRVTGARRRPKKIHRLRGVRADLVGRRAEMDRLKAAADRLLGGHGAVFTVCGTAGTGKSRLVEEFKATLDLEKVQWLEGQAYPYTRNVSYFPLIDLLARAFQIEEGDDPETMKTKIAAGVTRLLGDDRQAAPCIGSLYALRYPEMATVNPELWKTRLYDTIRQILLALARRRPAVVCLEDLHWADPSFLNFIRALLPDFDGPVLFLCVYRPVITLFTSSQAATMAHLQAIRIRDLSLSESQVMLESLLLTRNIPDELRHFVESRVEGNPFYLEEMINALIESDILVHEKERWRLSRPITEADIAASIHGVIAGRLDRLDLDTKRILQEAAVIGRVFYYKVLDKITAGSGTIAARLGGLERLDLIKTRSLEPDLEYMFKHAITQEVVYNGLLKKDRRMVHEKIGAVIEQLFSNRLPEFYETLAFHFSRGRSRTKAVDYLIKSADKSLARYASAEAHQYCRKAFDILSAIPERSRAENLALVDLLNSWGYVYYYLGEIKAFLDRFAACEAAALSTGDDFRLSMFHVWKGVALFMAGKTADAYNCLCRALELADGSGNQKAAGYACTWLVWVCAETGRFAEGIAYGERARQLARRFPADPYITFKPVGGLGLLHYYNGAPRRLFDCSRRLLEYGQKTANSRSRMMGHWMKGFGHLMQGESEPCIAHCQKAMAVSEDPSYAQFPKVTLGMGYVTAGRIETAAAVLEDIIAFCEPRAIGQVLLPAQVFYAAVLSARGRMAQGFALLETVKTAVLENQRHAFFPAVEYMFGMIYARIATGPRPGLAVIARNFGFLVKTVPTAAARAENHFARAIESAARIGSAGIQGQACLELGRLLKARKKKGPAREHLQKAAAIFKERGMTVLLEQARGELEKTGRSKVEG